MHIMKNSFARSIKGDSDLSLSRLGRVYGIPVVHPDGIVDGIDKSPNQLFE